MEDFEEEISIAVFGLPETGKTSFVNLLCGKNEERDEMFNVSLNLLEVIKNNDD